MSLTRAFNPQARLYKIGQFLLLDNLAAYYEKLAFSHCLEVLILTFHIDKQSTAELIGIRPA